MHDIIGYCTNADRDTDVDTALEFAHAALDSYTSTSDESRSYDWTSQQIARAIGQSLSGDIIGYQGSNISYHCLPFWDTLVPNVSAVSASSRTILQEMDPRALQLFADAVIKEHERTVEMWSSATPKESGATQNGIDAHVEQSKDKKLRAEKFFASLQH
jgi:hypothetical protein